MAQVGSVEQMVKEDGEIKPSWSYATRKTVGKGLLNLSLIMTNASQLKALFGISTDDRDGFWYTSLVLILLSFVLQSLVTVLLIVLGLNTARTEEKMASMTRMNNASVVLALFISVINTIIAAFGIQQS